MQKIFFGAVFIFLSFFSFTAMAGSGDFKAKLLETAAKRFDGKPEEYKAFSQKIGSELIEIADQALARTDFSPEDRRFALVLKYWGILRKDAFDDAVYNKQIEEFAASIENVPKTDDLYRLILDRRFSNIITNIYETDDPKERADEFISFRDRFFPYIVKKSLETNELGLASSLSECARYIDNNGSLGLVESTVENLKPTFAQLKKSAISKHYSEMIQGMAPFAALRGKELKYEAATSQGDVFDTAKYRGKIIFLNFQLESDPKTIGIHRKLYDKLHQSGLIMVMHDSESQTLDIARKKAEADGCPWIITSRFGAREKKLEDYYMNWGMPRSLVLVGRDGKVIGMWSHGLCPEACESLKSCFPEQKEFLSKIAAELVQIKLDEKKKFQTEYSVQSSNPLVNELYGFMIRLGNAVDQSGNNAFSDILSDRIVSANKLELADLLGSMPDLTPIQKVVANQHRLDGMIESANQRMKDDPKLKPEDAFADTLRVVEEIEKNGIPEDLNTVQQATVRFLFAMQSYLAKAVDKEKSAREFQKRYFDFVEKEIKRYQETSKDGKQGRFFMAHYIAMFSQVYINSLEDDEIPGLQTLVAPFCDELAPRLIESKIPELESYAKQLAGIAYRNRLIGKELEFECILLDGTKFDIKEHRGKIVLVNFWNTQCGPCRKEFPNMKTQYEKYKPKGYEMIAYSCGDTAEDLRKFLEKNPYPWLNGLSGLSTEKGLKNYDSFYGITANPTTFLVDRDGKVFFMMVGSNDKLLNKELEKAFAE